MKKLVLITFLLLFNCGAFAQINNSFDGQLGGSIYRTSKGNALGGYFSMSMRLAETADWESAQKTYKALLKKNKLIWKKADSFFTKNTFRKSKNALLYEKTRKGSWKQIPDWPFPKKDEIKDLLRNGKKVQKVVTTKRYHKTIWYFSGAMESARINREPNPTFSELAFHARKRFKWLPESAFLGAGIRWFGGDAGTIEITADNSEGYVVFEPMLYIGLLSDYSRFDTVLRITPTEQRLEASWRFTSHDYDNLYLGVRVLNLYFPTDREGIQAVSLFVRVSLNS